VARPAPGPRRALLLVAVLLVALNLRGAIAAVSPVLPEIRADLGMSAAAAGLLTTLPVVCFAAAAPAAAWLSRRVGTQRSVLIGCLAVAVGIGTRVLDGVPVLMLGTLLVGIAMTIGNVAVPVVIKRDFGHRGSTVTPLYTAALTGGAAAAAAATAPLAIWLGWRPALAVWALLALAAAAVWHLVTRRPANGRTHAATRTNAAGGVDEVGRGGTDTRRDPRLWRDPVAWSVTLFLGFQSMCYYSVTAWLPTLLLDEVAIDLPTAGVAMSIFQLLGIGGTLLIPLLVPRRRHQSWLGICVAAGWAALVLGLLLWPQAWVVWTLVGGVAQGAGISFAFTVLVLRAYDAAAARALSSMTQLIGYALGAAGPVVIGALYEGTRGWALPLALLLAVTVGQALAAVLAGRDTTVGHPPTSSPHGAGTETERTTSTEAAPDHPRKEE
jgi:MFS transporter, CP family, cyanate transporter